MIARRPADRARLYWLYWQLTRLTESRRPDLPKGIQSDAKILPQDARNLPQDARNQSDCSVTCATQEKLSCLKHGSTISKSRDEAQPGSRDPPVTIYR